MSSSKPAPFLKDTAVGDTVEVEVTVDGPYGIIFEPDQEGNAAYIFSWERLPNGQIGDVQRHSGVHVNDVLFAVNDIDISALPHQQAMRVIRDRNLLKKIFHFMSNKEYYRRKKLTSKATITSKNKFLSVIKQARVRQVEGSRSQYAEYEVLCQMRSVGLGIEKEKICKWSVWRRYSEIKKLFYKMKNTLGWQMDKIVFPPSYMFTINKLSVEFLEMRKNELNQMWLQLTSIDRVTEFDKHYCDRDLRNFLRGEPDMFAEIGVPSLRINQPVSGGGDTSAVWDDEGYTEAGNGVTSPINSPQNPQNLNVQPRQRRPRAH